MRKTGLGEDEATCCVQGSLLALEWTVAGSVGGVGACDYGSAVLSLGTFSWRDGRSMPVVPVLSGFTVETDCCVSGGGA